MKVTTFQEGTADHEPLLIATTEALNIIDVTTCLHTFFCAQLFAGVADT